MELLKSFGFILMFVLLLGNAVQVEAQNCTAWTSLPNKDEIVQAHVLYRGFLKDSNWDEAFKYWETAYNAAPAADGQRAFHFSDGRILYMNKYKEETDEAKKKEYVDIILKLYDEEIECYKNVGFTAGRKAYDMFYTFNSPAEDVYAELKKSLDAGGNASEYIIFAPFGTVMTQLFEAGKLNKEEIIKNVEKLDAIAEHNIKNNADYGQYYADSQASMSAALRPIENQVFDCDYLKKVVLPKYTANPDDLDNVKFVYSRLINGGCDKNDPGLAEISAKFEALTAAENEKIMAEYEAKNPAAAARRLYEDGKFKEAIEKFDEALEADIDNDTKAQILFSKASIQGRKLNQYSAARSTAYEAAKLKSGWGAPYMLIGDLYASSSRSCSSEDIKQRIVIIAAIDMYQKAKSVDGEVAADAQKKINLYTASLPDKGEAFMQGYEEGQKVNTGCWIGETVTLRFK